MVPRAVSDGEPPSPVDPVDLPAIEVHRVGPGGDLAADSSFGVALTGLWHAVSQAGGSVGFVPPVERPSVAARVAPVVEALRAGRSQAVVGIFGRSLVGFGELRPGLGLQAHTGHIVIVMVHPEHAGSMLGSRIVTALIALARESGLTRLDLSVRDGEGLEHFFPRFGFVIWGRRPRWIRVAPGDYRDEICYLLELDS